jgi:hypothetical protein
LIKKEGEEEEEEEEEESIGIFQLPLISLLSN